MQLHCDQGMNAARAMYEAKQTPSEYLAAHPDVAQKYQRDPAFHHGFNGMVFAHDNGQYAEVVMGLDARDARYDAHHVAWRG
jgi:maltose-binding protein MalE